MPTKTQRTKRKVKDRPKGRQSGQAQNGRESFSLAAALQSSASRHSQVRAILPALVYRRIPSRGGVPIGKPTPKAAHLGVRPGRGAERHSEPSGGFFTGVGAACQAPERSGAVRRSASLAERGFTGCEHGRSLQRVWNVSVMEPSLPGSTKILLPSRAAMARKPRCLRFLAAFSISAALQYPQAAGVRLKEKSSLKT